jgi:hypothetical protein
LWFAQIIDLIIKIRGLKMTDDIQGKTESGVAPENSKKEWVTPEVVDYDYASITKGGANLMGVDDTSGDNYRLS